MSTFFSGLLKKESNLTSILEQINFYDEKKNISFVEINEIFFDSTKKIWKEFSGFYSLKLRGDCRHT